MEYKKWDDGKAEKPLGLFSDVQTPLAEGENEKCGIVQQGA